MNSRLLIHFLIMLSVAASAMTSHALEVQTHEEINRNIALKSLNGFSLGTYLKDQLGFENGAYEEFNSKMAWELLRDGGRYEDIPYWYMPYLRSFNHFHNPLTDSGYGPWNSAVMWSQRPKVDQSPGGYYSWNDARDYFYKALTSQEKSERDTNFASTFRGLGQLMHLVQDMSVPEHSRSDGHVKYCYENWVLDVQQDKKPQWTNIWTNALANPVFYNKDALLLASRIPGVAVPIANLFDTNQYTGSNPDATLQNDVGLAEYSNANFLSPDTIFTAEFTNPNWSGAVLSDLVVLPSGDMASYLKKLGKNDPPEGGKSGSGESVQHLAAVRWPFKYLPEDKKYGKYLLLNDDNVYADYATLLLPRAVGYSSQLLSYFFRGQINMVPDEATGSGYVIENNSDEDMNGTFELYYDTTNDERSKITLSNDTFSLGKFGSGNNKSPNIFFTKPANAKEPGKYILVFRGRLGNEEDAVVANIFIDGYVYAFLHDSVPSGVLRCMSIRTEPCRSITSSRPIR